MSQSVLPRPTRNKRLLCFSPPCLLPLFLTMYDLITPPSPRTKTSQIESHTRGARSLYSHYMSPPTPPCPPSFSIPLSRMSLFSLCLSLYCVKANARSALISLCSSSCCRSRVQPLRGDSPCDCSMMMIVLFDPASQVTRWLSSTSCVSYLGMYILDCFAVFLCLGVLFVRLALQSM